ncbi:MAG: ATP-binding cassette domain-containing protein [Bacteroidales bacterium]|nr:ATP-binding cassette domain-containing protein [Bacteroidales bacterium]
MGELGFKTGIALPLIELENADIYNDGNLILSGVNLKVKRGEFVYLVGKVGSGKSSIIRTLTAELPLISGEGRVGDFDLKTIRKNQIPYLRRNLGVVFQDFQLLMDQTVMENLMFVLRSTEWDDLQKMQERCMEVLKVVGMENKAHKMPHQLSGGEQQRVAIARAILNSPSVILADEPTGNLDAETAAGIMDALLRIHKQYSPAVLMITHNRSIIDRYPARIMMCANGVCTELTNNGVEQDKLKEVADDMPDDYETENDGEPQENS